MVATTETTIVNSVASDYHHVEISPEFDTYDYVIVQRPHEEDSRESPEKHSRKPERFTNLAEHGPQSAIRMVVGNAPRKCNPVFSIRRVFGFGTRLACHHENSTRIIQFTNTKQPRRDDTLAMGTIDDVD